MPLTFPQNLLDHQGNTLVKCSGKLGYGGGDSRYVMSYSYDPTNCSQPGSSVHGISQAILDWVAIFILMIGHQIENL